MGKKRIALFGTILLGFALSAAVYAVGVNARLKAGIESNILYYSEKIAALSSMNQLNLNSFKANMTIGLWRSSERFVKTL